AGEPVPEALKVEIEAGDAWLTAARALWLEALEQAGASLADPDAGGAPPAQASEALQGTLAQADPTAAILQIVVGAQRTYLLLTTAKAQAAHTVQVSAEVLNAEVAALRRAVGDPRAPYRAAAEQVYRRVIEPVRGELNAAGVKTLVVSLDGALRYVPLAALVDPATGRHLVERFALARYHDAARGQLERQGPTAWRVAGLGVTEAKAGFTPLPAVGRELEAIVRRAADDPDGVAEGIVRLDAEFDRSTLAAALAGPFPGVHLASHFQFKPGVDRSSFLLLGDGAQLTVADLWAGSFDFKGVDLLVLSACETAVDGGDGREVDGLAGVVQRRGVRSVVASLWPVADDSTATLMARFYEAMTSGTPRAQALQAAQRTFLAGASAAKGVKPGATEATRGVARADGGGAGFVADPERPYAHPYYWAPFVLMGAWR
ncbi:MAG: CHAT domain-containing protein, partial [Myxococcales bacterium]|nr:CHAT domain-containing protein [Myxococcales bacterium]